MLSDNGFHAGALARGALLAVVLGLAAASAAQANDPWIVAQRQADPSANPARESWMPVSRQAAGAREDRDSTGPFNPAPEESQPDAAAAGCAPAGDTPPPDAPSDR